MIKITATGFNEVKDWLTTIERGLKGKATEWFAEYLVGDQSHGLKHYSPYQYVPYRKAYGGFFSDKQRRYVMAMIQQGKIDPGYPHRTGEFQRAWEYKVSGSGRYTITNATPYGGYLVDDNKQARLPGMAGWRKVSEIIKDNWHGAIRHATAKVKQWIKDTRRR